MGPTLIQYFDPPFAERQSARKDGAFIPPTPATHLGGHQKQKPPLVPIGALPGPVSGNSFYLTIVT